MRDLEYVPLEQLHDRCKKLALDLGEWLPESGECLPPRPEIGDAYTFLRSATRCLERAIAPLRGNGDGEPEPATAEA